MLQPIISKVLQVSYSVSPLFTEDVEASKFITFNLCLCSATSKLCFVLVEFSKNKFATYKSSRGDTCLPFFNSKPRFIKLKTSAFVKSDIFTMFFIVIPP